VEIFIFTFILLFLPVVIWLSWKNPLYLLATHISSRVVLDSLPLVTYIEVLPGVSFMEIYTIAFIGIISAYLLAKGQSRAFTYAWPVSAMVVTFFFSALVNFSWTGMLSISARWLYFWIIVALTIYTFSRNSNFKTLLVICLSFLYPLLNQFYHFLFTPPKMDQDIWSYMGSYAHESNLGFLLLGALVVSTVLFLEARQKYLKIIFFFSIVYLHWAIFINNYRTATAAIAVYWSVILFFNFSRINLAAKMMLITISSVVLVMLVFLLGENLGYMFKDVADFIVNPSAYVDFSGAAEQNHLFSGRLDILNEVVSAWLHSSVENYVFGLGPGSVDSLIGVYAHNEFLSALVEMGVVGLLVTAIVTYHILRKNYKIVAYLKNYTLYYYSMIVAIIFMALATMPFRNMRAMLVMAICVGAIEAAKMHRINEIRQGKLLRPKE
jgi:O-antigen ligase/polysaccharide polymerase Wzy-like membrane protein